MTFSLTSSNFKLPRLAAMAVVCLFLLPTPASAQPTGCNPAVLTAMQDKAQAEVTADVARTEQTVVKPDSVMALTCMNGAAGASAARIATLFGGEFLSNTVFTSVIDTMLAAFLNQFADAEGRESGAVSYASTTVQDTSTCNEFGNLWTRIIDKALTPGVASMKVGDIINGIIPALAGTKFQQNINTATTDRIFSNLQRAITQLPLNAVPDFAGTVTACDVFATAGYSFPCP
jgi:hypothetical protein